MMMMMMMRLLRRDARYRYNSCSNSSIKSDVTVYYRREFLDAAHPYSYRERPS